MKFFKLFITDVKATYNSISLTTYIKVIANPSMRASLLIRLGTTYKNKTLHTIVRNLLIFTHSIDIGYGVTIGKALIIPHPMNIVFGMGAIIGDSCVIYHNCTIGSKDGGYPTLLNECVVFPNSVLVGEIVIGEKSIIGANSFVDKDVGPNTKYMKAR